MPRRTTLVRSVFSAAFFALMAANGFAQEPSDAATQRSRVISVELNALYKKGDLAGAREKAMEASKAFAKEGEAWLSASYVVAAAEYDIRMNDVRRIEAEIFPRMQELLAVLDPVDSSRGDVLVELVMDAKGALGQAGKQDELATLYEDRIRKTSGEGSEADLTARFRAAASIIQGGRFDDGYARLRKALEAASRTDLHALTIANYVDVTGKLIQSGRLQQAADLFAEAEKTPALQQDIKERADFYLAAAQFYWSAAKNWEMAYPRFQSAVSLARDKYGFESVQAMNALDKFAMALRATGQLGSAGKLFVENRNTALKVLGPDHEMTFQFTNNLAQLLREMGAASRALEFDKVVLEKAIASSGRESVNAGASANNIGQDYLMLANYDEAMRYFQTSREIAVALQAQYPELLAQSDVWILYTQLVSGAKPFDDPSISAMEGLIANGSDYPPLLSINAANLLAEHFAKAGDRARAMKHLEQAYQIAGSAFGVAHPRSFEARLAMANAKADTDVAAAAADFATLDVEMLQWNAMQVAYAGGRDFAEATRALADDMLSDYAALAENDPSIVSAFADAARRWPSLDDGHRDNLRKISRAVGSKDPAVQSMLAEVMRLSYAHQEIMSSSVTETDLGNELNMRMDTVGIQIDERLATLGMQVEDKPLPTARELLAPDQVLVQYFITRKWKQDRDSADPFIATRLYALVSRRDREPKLYNLGDPRAITSQEATVAMASLRSTRSADTRGAVPLGAVKQEFSGLYGKLLAPLESELADAGTVFIIPDGQLFAVPFSLLQDGQGRLLEERVTVRLLTKPESLYNVTAEQVLPKGGRAVLAGGLDYTNAAEKGAEPLPGTLKEVEAISTILGKDQFTIGMLTGAAASEGALKKEMEGATIAHLATHGAYRSPKAGGAADVDTLWQSDVILSRSGDRQSMKRDADDGRLYAFELMTWDLSGLDLLVLSACETGRGEETFVGGLRGLPTAINIAGAKRSLLTLWPVEDTGTANFMVRFYEHLSAGSTYPEALRQTRRDAIGGKIHGARDPLVWAAFVMFEN